MSTRPRGAISVMGSGAMVASAHVGLAVQMEPQTRQKIEELLAKHDENRARIKTLRMNGTFRRFVEERSPPGKISPRVLQSQYTFEYYQSGDKRRMDKHHQIAVGPRGQPPEHQGQTTFVVYAAPLWLENQTGRDDRNGIGEYDPLNWQWKLEISWLDQFNMARDVPSDMHRIRRILDRP